MFDKVTWNDEELDSQVLWKLELFTVFCNWRISLCCGYPGVYAVTNLAPDIEVTSNERKSVIQCLVEAGILVS